MVTHGEVDSNGSNTTSFTFNYPYTATIENAHLHLNFISDGELVAELSSTFDLEAGPTVHSVNWSTSLFSPPYDPDADNILLAFWTDNQDNIIDSTARPLNTFADDPEPAFASESNMTWNFGTATQGEVLNHTFTVANTGFANLSTHLTEINGISITGAPTSRPIAPGDTTVYTLTLDTSAVPVGRYNRSLTLRTSDPDNPTRTVQVIGSITDAELAVQSAPYRPLDLAVTIPGTSSSSQWIEFSHPLGPDPESLHPVKVYSQDGETLWGMGKYASDFGDGAASGNIFGNGSDGDLVVESGQTVSVNSVRTSVADAVAAGESVIPVGSTVGFNISDNIFILQTQGTGAGNYELATIQSIGDKTITLQNTLEHSYSGYPYTHSECGGGFFAEYFNNRHLSGEPLLTRCDTSVWFDWGGGSPGGGVPNNNFSVRWTSQMVFPTDGNYIFQVTVDDGIRIYLDGNLVLNEWHPADSNTYTIQPFISAGSHTLVIEYYEDGGGAKVFLTLPLNSSPAQVVKVPQYRNVTVQNGGTLSATSWDGRMGGILIFSANGTVTVDGTISAKGKGFRGGQAGEAFKGAQYYTGEGKNYGWNTHSRTGRGGAGGGGTGELEHVGSGGGAGHGTSGANGRSNNGTRTYGLGGAIYDNNSLSKGTLGAGGGGGGARGTCCFAGAGGSGGGLIFILGQNLYLNRGSINANGNNGGTGYVNGGHSGDTTVGGGGGGGGAGGSILVRTQSATLGTNKIVSKGGAGGNGDTGNAVNIYGGAGGNGRIRIEYCDSLTGRTNPAASEQKLDCYIAEQVESTPYESGKFSLPESFSSGRTYKVQYGRRLVFDSGGEQTIKLRVPAENFSGATLDALVSGMGTDSLTFKLDVGDDGSWDWQTSQSVTSTATLASLNLAEAFNAYWTSQGSPTSGTLDVPVKVSLSTGGQVLLTNLVMTPTPPDGTLTANDITFGSSSPIEGQTVPVTARVHNPTTLESGPLTVGFYAAVPGWGDWHIGSAFVSSIPANGATQTSIQWNTEGFTGTVPVRAVIDPFNHVVERDETNNEATQEITILTRPDLKVISIEPEEAARQGLLGNLLVTVQNGGDSDAGSQVVSLYHGDPDDGGTLIGTQTVAVSAHNSQVISIPWTPSTLGPLTFYAKVDSLNAISEFNEANNLGSQTIYVGWGDPVYIDAGSPNDQAYDPSVGYGYLTDGTTVSNCGNDPERTYHEMGSTQALEYQFDHLLPDRFYHLDLTFFLCSGNREQRILVDGVEVLGSVSANNQPNTISLLLDPTLYADNQIVVAIEKIGDALGGAVVSELKLTDIRYCYRDSGHPTEASYASATDGCGWLNGTAAQNWGTRTYESVRYVNGGNLQYRFDGLESAQAYQLNLTFYQNDHANRVQSVLIDDITVLNNISLSNTIKELTVDVPLSSYADGTILVEIAGTKQTIISEIALEQKTIRDSGPTPTPSPTPTVPTSTPTVSATMPTSTPTVTGTSSASTPIATNTATNTPIPDPSSPMVRTGNYQVVSGNTFTMTVEALNLPSPGLGAAKMSVFYDPTLIQPTQNACSFELPLFVNCNTKVSGEVKFNAISTSGVVGDFDVVQIAFTVIGESDQSSLLDINVAEFSDPDGNAISVTAQDGTITFGGLLGDVDCDTQINTVDGLFILQYDVDKRNGSKQCPLPQGTLYTPHCDVNADVACNVIDGMFVLQCDIGISNVLCPTPLSHARSSGGNQQTEGGGDATVTIGTHQMEPLTTVTVPVNSTLPDGVSLGAANLRITYDANVVQVNHCTINSSLGICNTDTSGVIEFNIVSTSGISGSFDLAEITFQAIGQAGNSTPLDMEVKIFADTSGNAIPVNEVDGQIAIVPSVTLTPTTNDHLLYLPLLLR